MSEIVMEGRDWHRTAREHGAKLVPKMKPGKVYLYQLYTTCFVEFDTKEAAEKFRAFADTNLGWWDYDPVATIDTSDPEVVKRWKDYMEV